jgi:hypothetical protein
VWYLCVAACVLGDAKTQYYSEMGVFKSYPHYGVDLPVVLRAFKVALYCCVLCLLRPVHGCSMMRKLNTIQKWGYLKATPIAMLTFLWY